MIFCPCTTIFSRTIQSQGAGILIVFDGDAGFFKFFQIADNGISQLEKAAVSTSNGPESQSAASI